MIFLFFILYVRFVLSQVFDCDIKAVRGVFDSLGYDRNALETYDQLMMQIRRSCDGSQWDSILNQLGYNSGIIFLTLGQDLQAMSSFERVLKSEDESFQNLSWTRLKEIYVKYGYWDKLPVEYDDQKKKFIQLENTILDKLHTGNYETMYADFEDILQISPYSISTRILFNDFLLEQLSQVLDLNIGQNIVDNLQTILEKHGSMLNLETKLELLYDIAITQLFVLNVQPQITLRKCLNIDMDYQHCKNLMKIWNAVTKKLPPLSKLTNAEEYLSFETSWKELKKFLLESRKTILNTFNGITTNFELLKDFNDKCISRLLNERPLTHWEKSYTSIDTQSDFILSIQVMICESQDFSSSFKKTSDFCSFALNQILTSDEQRTLELYTENLTGVEKVDEILLAMYETYPHLVINLLNNIVNILVSKEEKDTGFDSYIHWSLLYKCVQKTHIAQSTNDYIRNLCSLITSKFQANYQQSDHASGNKFRNFEFKRNQQRNNWHKYQGKRSTPSPPTRTDKDYYKILGIEKSATAKDIRKSYLLLTKKFHPDKQKSLSAENKLLNEEKMSLINEAYEILSDEEKRKEYDSASLGHKGWRNQNQGFRPFNQFTKNSNAKRTRPNQRQNKNFR